MFPDEACQSTQYCTVLQVWITIAQGELTKLQGVYATCSRCSKKGHFQPACKANVRDDRKGNRCRAAIQSTTSNRSASNEIPMLHQSVDQFTIYAIGSAQDYYVFLNGKQTLCVVDTGSQLYIIPKHLTDNLKLVPTNVTLNAYGGFKL